MTRNSLSWNKAGRRFPKATEERPLPSPELFMACADEPRFLIDVLECPRCKEPRRILCATHPLEANRKILDCLGISTRLPPLSSTVPEEESLLLLVISCWLSADSAAVVDIDTLQD
jgi:hypothetical protein